jgi:hypothetical protein
MLRNASLRFAFLSLLSLLAAPAFAQAPAVETPKAEMPKAEIPKAEAPKVEAPKVEPAMTETAKPAADKVDDKQTGKMRARYKKMTPEQREELRKKAEGRLGERYDRLKTAEQENIKSILADIAKLNKEQRSILMAKIRQQAHKDRLQRKAMKDMETGKKPAPERAVESKPEHAADPNAAVKH